MAVSPISVRGILAPNGKKSRIMEDKQFLQYADKLGEVCWSPPMEDGGLRDYEGLCRAIVNKESAVSDVSVGGGEIHPQVSASGVAGSRRLDIPGWNVHGSAVVRSGLFQDRNHGVSFDLPFADYVPWCSSRVRGGGCLGADGGAQQTGCTGN